MVKENKKKEENLFGIFKHPLQFEGVEEVLQREIRNFGASSAHIVIPKKHEGKDAIVTIKSTKEFKKKRLEEEKKKK